MTLEQMKKKAVTIKSMVTALTLALDVADSNGCQSAEFVPAMREVEGLLVELTEAIDAAFDVQHIDLVG